MQNLFITNLCADLVKLKWNGEESCLPLSTLGLRRLEDKTQATLSWFQFLSSGQLLPSEASWGLCLFSWLQQRVTQEPPDCLTEMIDGCQIHSAEASLWLLSRLLRK